MKVNAVEPVGFKKETDVPAQVRQDIKQSEKVDSHPNGLTSRNRHGDQMVMNNTSRHV